MKEQVMETVAVQEGVHERPSDKTLPPDDRSPYVLVVDDEAVVRDFLARCLNGWGYSARAVGSAAEALELMMEKPAALVLCDIRMPGQDGLWLTDRLRAHWPNTPIVMISAIDDPETVRRSHDIGATDYIAKPINPEILLPIIRQFVTADLEAAGAEASPAEIPSGRQAPATSRFDAEYTLEHPLKCPACGERITHLKAVRILRAKVNFTSTLPRRGRVVACPHCLSVIPVELTNF